MAKNAIKRLLSTGLKSYSGVLGAQVQAAREEEERRRLKNQETMAALLGYSLRDQRRAATAESIARTKKLGEPEPEEEPEIKYTFDLGPGFKATTTGDEGVKKIAAGLGVDVESLFDRASADDPYAGVKRTAETPGGRITGPYDEATGAIKAMGGISPEEPLKPTNIGGIYGAAEGLAKIAVGGEDEWEKLSLSQQSEKMDFFARQLWERENPGIPYKGIEFPEMGQGQVPEERGWFRRRGKAVADFFGFGGGEQAAPTQPQVGGQTPYDEEFGQYGSWEEFKADYDDHVKKGATFPPNYMHHALTYFKVEE